LSKYRTYDIYQAGYFVLKGEAVKVEKDERGKVVFEFGDRNRIEELLAEFDKGDMVVVANYVSVVKNLRSRMYNLLNGEG